MRTFAPALAALLLAACTGTATSGPSPDDLDEAKGLVRAMQPKDEAMKAVEGKLGAPAKVDENGASWFAKDGERCKELHIQLMGDMVGNVDVKKADCPE